ncbi:aarF domain-containing kinase [Marchantia polymorpha subsp. ruderalis]
MAGLAESLVGSSSSLGGLCRVQKLEEFRDSRLGCAKFGDNAGPGCSSRKGVRDFRIRNAIGNGGDGNSRMVPIEEAIKRTARTSSFVSSSSSSANGLPLSALNGVEKSRKEKFRETLLPDRPGPDAFSVQSSRPSAGNGAANVTTRRAAANGAVLLRETDSPAERLNGRSTTAITQVPSRTRITRRPPVELPVIDSDLRILPSDEGFSWAKDNYSPVQRTIDIWSFVLQLRARVFLLDAKWTYIGGFNEERQKARRRATASWVRECILQLGPTFIKLGQLSSTRSDLFPAEFVEELAKLQDRVPAFSPEKAMALIEKELGSPVDELFMQFERQPIAAASLGQVHRAILFNGEKVAVKVQRPGLKELFDIDLDNLKRIAEYFQNSESMGGPTRDWLGIYEECKTILYEEIDYLNEGRNADRFRRDFRNIKWARVPQIYWDYASRKVLTLEYVPGIKINEVAKLDAGGFDRRRIARLAIEAYLIQILKTGFFHADPHPGNLAVDTDGSLIYYDFGMMGDIKSFTREKLLEMFYAVYEKDAQKVINALIDLGALLPTGDMGPVRKTVKFFLDNLMNQKPDQASTFSAIGEDLFAIAIDQPFRFPATFTFVLRAFSTLEGIGTILDPDLSFAKIAAPYAQELLDVRDKQSDGRYIVQELQRQATDARDAAVAMPLRIQRMDEIIQKLEAGDFKLRVRVLEAERAARRASIQQSATMNVVVAACLANIGVNLMLAEGMTPIALSPFVGTGIFLVLVLNSMRRLKNLDKFEKML